MEWTIAYYSDDVCAWIDALPVGIRAYYARITERMRISGPNLKMPFTRALGNDLFEIRAIGKEGIARIFYCTAVNRKIIMLHGFIKKSQKTPRKELSIARKRMQEVLSHDVSR